MFNLSKKNASMIQVWVCVLLTVLALVMSFMPIVKLQTIDHKSDMYELMDTIGIEEKLPEEVEISAVGLIKSGKLIIDIISTATGDETDDAKLTALQNKLSSEDAKKTAMMALAIVATTSDAVSDNNDGAKSDSSFLSTLFEVVIILGALFGVLGMAIALPITMLVKTIKTIIVASKNIGTPDAAVASVGSSLASSLTLILTLMVFQTLIPGMSYATGLIAIFWIAAISVVMNMAMSRITPRSKSENMYLNVVQGASVVGSIGFAVFFFNMLKANMFSSFMGTYTSYLTQVASTKTLAAAYHQKADINNAYIIDGILVVASWALLLATIGYFVGSMARLACIKKDGDSELKGSILAVIVAAFAKYLVGAKHGYIIVTSQNSEGDYSFLDGMSGAEVSALDMVLVGAIIMLVVEIALIILKKVLCADLTKEQMKGIVAGEAVETVAAEAAPATEEAPAAEEAPVTIEFTAEEAPAEEAPAEEAPADDTTEVQ